MQSHLDWTKKMLEAIKVFVTGGLICVVAQILIDKTKISPPKIVVLFVVSGVILTALGIYDKIVEFGGAGATVPLTGFGYTLAKGVEESVKQEGVLGCLTGPLKASAGGITGAIFFGLIVSLIFHSKEKN